ncbi:MAG: uracil-DNA glycosylase, partial [Victivallaceae bacterium]|nr:uracil-DNA glycosylase [Victivallaceae bacterium]
MQADKKTVFDEITEHLRELQTEQETAVIAPDVLNDFFTDAPPVAVEKPRPQAKRFPSPAAVPAPTGAGSDSALLKMTLAELNSTVQYCQKCPLAKTRTNVVFGEGAPDAELMFIGEGPGYDEDQQGRPFVGKAGELLTRMIAAMQFTRQEVYIGNIVKCRPP